MTVIEDFKRWIIGMQEDDPLPYEIRYVYFLITFTNNSCSLMFCGSENFEKQLINFEYFPLEAQYFFNPTLSQITELNLAMIVLKQLLEDCFDDNAFKKVFKGKHIYYGEYANKVMRFDNKSFD